MNTFIQKKKARWTSKQETFVVQPKILIYVLGEPFEADDYKVSGEYYFYDEDGNEITLYDWKSTSLYDDTLLSPKEFWESDSIYEFSIGAEDKPQAKKFKEWLITKFVNHLKISI
jgi:hypothetical protein